jgi:hypothetical protein
MRIDEITEALPGQVGGIGKALGKVGLGRLAGRASAADAKFRYKAKQAYRLWLTQVPKLQQGGIAINDQKIYADYFGRWMAPNLKLDKNDKIIKAAVKELSIAPTVGKNYMINLIAKMMGQQRASSIKPPATRSRTSTTPPAAGAPSQIQAGTELAAGGIKYVWNGAEWKNSTNGQAATAPIAAVLTAQAAGATP